MRLAIRRCNSSLDRCTMQRRTRYTKNCMHASAAASSSGSIWMRLHVELPRRAVVPHEKWEMAGS
jgi:hypothetical protein